LIPFEAGKLLYVLAVDAELAVAATFICVGLLNPPPIPDAIADAPEPIADGLMVFDFCKFARSL
jgi:hypothetical protein